jgi:hypothetical protein
MCTADRCGCLKLYFKKSEAEMEKYESWQKQAKMVRKRCQQVRKVDRSKTNDSGGRRGRGPDIEEVKEDFPGIQFLLVILTDRCDVPGIFISAISMVSHLDKNTYA